MKKNILAISLLCLSFFSTLQLSAQTWKWAKGSACPNGTLESWPVAVDRFGNVYESGIPSSLTLPYSELKCIFGADTISNPRGISLVSTDSNGNFRWALGATGGGGEIWKMTTDFLGNLILFGDYYGSLTMGGHSISSATLNAAFCAKLSPSGAVLWLKSIVDSGFTQSGAVDASGNIYVAGSFQSAHVTIGSTTLNNTSHGNSQYDIYVTKLDPSGTPVWAKSFGGDSLDAVYGLGVNPDGEVCISGKFTSPTLTIGTTTLSYTPTTGNQGDLFVFKLDGSGNAQWAKQVETVGNTYLNDMVVDAWGNAYLAGGFTTTITFPPYSLSASGLPMFLTKYDNSGNVKWAKTSGKSYCGFASAMAADGCGNVWVSGWGAPPGMFSVAPGYNDAMFLFNFDSSGSLISDIYLKCGGDDQSGLAIDNRGNLYVGGDYLSDTFIVGNDTLRLESGTIETQFLAKYSYPFCATPYLETSANTGIEAKLSVFPNPATDECTITTNNAISIAKVTIYDMTGRIVQEENANSTQITLRTSKLKTGIYLCRVMTADHNEYTEKLIIN